MSTDPKNVVVIGASSAGAAIARQLEKKLPPTHRVVLIDSSSFSFFPIAALRAAVVPGWEEKVFAELETFFSKGSRHVVLPSTRVTQLADDFVEVDHANEAQGFSTRIPFEYAVLATGSTYGSPMRLIAKSTEAGKESLRALQKEVAAAQSIVLVGGGTVGIEYAGEILEHHPKKKVTLIQASNRLLNDDWPMKLSDRLADDLKALGCEVIYGEKVPTDVLERKQGTIALKDGKQIQADLIFATAGIKPNSQLVAAAAPEALTAKGFVKVDPNLKIDSQQGPFASGKYFAAGDVADSPGGPTAISAGNDGGVVAANVLALVSGSSSLKKVSHPGKFILIPVGSKRGGGQLPLVGTVGNWITSKIKDTSLFVDKFAATFPANRASEPARSSSMSLHLLGASLLIGAAAILLVQTGHLDRKSLALSLM